MAIAGSHVCSYADVIICFLIVSFIYVRVWRFVVSLTDRLMFLRNYMTSFSCFGIHDRFVDNYVM